MTNIYEILNFYFKYYEKPAHQNIKNIKCIDEYDIIYKDISYINRGLQC